MDIPQRFRVGLEVVDVLTRSWTRESGRRVAHVVRPARE